MKLGDIEIIPGVVIDNNDPLKGGRVKACAPGLFDTSTMDVDDLLWISPWMMTGFQSYSKLEINSKIWILHNIKNYFEYWYVPMFELNECSPEVTDEEMDIIMSREVNGNKVQVYFSRSEGFKIINGNNCIVLNSDGNLNIRTNGTQISSDSNYIKLIKEGEEEFSAVKAEKLMSLLNTLSIDLSNIGLACGLNPYTASLSKDLINASSHISESLDEIKSSTVKIS